MRPHLGRLGDLPPATAAGRRRARQLRLSAYREHGRLYGWQLLGLHEDLSRTHPVAPFVGAASAQAELALAGRWEGRPAVVASVLVRPRAAPGVRSRDVVVQLSSVDTGRPSPCQFTAVWHLSVPEVAGLCRRGPQHLDHVPALLQDAGRSGGLRPGDQLACIDTRLLHTRVLVHSRSAPDLQGPLRSLAVLAARLGA